VQEELSADLGTRELEKTGVAFIGHGTPDKDSAQIYREASQRLVSLFPASLKIAFGNVEFSAPYCRDVLGELIMSGISAMLVQPFMVVDGVHIHDDIRGAFEGTQPENKLYRYLLERYNGEFTQRLKEITFIYKPGLGAYQGIVEIFADHTVKAGMDNEVL
jgi:cobalamin biosynthesis Co2+ chelatase CbiK